jgi:hypothetical protein
MTKTNRFTKPSWLYQNLQDTLHLPCIIIENSISDALANKCVELREISPSVWHTVCTCDILRERFLSKGEIEINVQFVNLYLPYFSPVFTRDGDLGWPTG